MSLTLKNIPHNWQLKKLKDVSEFSNGKGHEQAIDENGEYIVVNSKFISTDGRVKKFSTQNLSPLNCGDITMVMSDIPNGKAIAKCFIIDKDNRYTLNQRICSIKPNKNCDTKFLYYVINRNRYYLAFDNGVSQTNFRKEEVLDCPIQFPPLPEQQKIAEILSTVDDKIEVIAQQIIETQALKKGLMQRLLTKGIGNTEFKNSPLGEIPMSWEVVELEKLVNPKRPIRYGIVQTGEYIENGIPCIRVVDFNNREFNKRTMITTSPEISNSYKTTILEVGDIVFPLRGRIGAVKLVNENALGANLTRGIALISNSKKINPAYLYWQIRSNSVKKLIELEINGTTLKEVPIGGLKKILIPISSSEEQSKISAILNCVEDKLTVLEDKKTHYQELKLGLMQQLLTGKIRVNV